MILTKSVGRSMLALTLLIGATAQVQAQSPPPEPKRPWSDSAEFSFINTTGNTENTKLALKVGYLIRYDNEPVQSTIADTVAPLGGPDLIFTRDKTDTILSAALVVNF